MVISVINLKGGVGKTTTAMALAALATRHGRRATVMDCDPQASATRWRDEAEDRGEDLGFEVKSANMAEIERLRRHMDPDRVYIIDCPPNGNVVDSAAKASDIVIVPTGTGEADFVKTMEVSGTLTRLHRMYAVLITGAIPRTRTLEDAVTRLDKADESYLETVIPARESLKRAFGHALPDVLFGYEKVYDEIMGSGA